MLSIAYQPVELYTTLVIWSINPVGHSELGNKYLLWFHHKISFSMMNMNDDDDLGDDGGVGISL